MKIFSWTLVIVHTLVVLAAAGHALLFKRDSRAALGWIAVCLLFPFAGPFLYFLFGINRVRTRAQKLDRLYPFRIRENDDQGYDPAVPAEGDLCLPPESAEIVRVSETVTRLPLLAGNRVEILHNGEQAYPAMLEAIESSERSLFLSTYIFDTNDTGLRFIDALARCARRGVDVRIIIDGIGELYAIPRAGTLLQKEGVRVARFLPPRLIPPSVHINLRNHRKIMVADGSIAFVGGMNIGDRHLAENLDNPSRVVDAHFRVAGPVISQIERTFLEDWRFTTGEPTAAPPTSRVPRGSAFCRAIVEGPNEDWDKLASILLGAVSAASRRVTIMTPYFIPSREMIGAMVAAALRGVEVQVVLPGKNNLPLVHWASRNMLWEFLQRGIRVYYQPPPFVHTKLFIVDDHYVQIGSANIDPRSLRLNFELAIEVFDRPFAACLTSHVEGCIGRAREISLEEVDRRPLPIRTRDALAWLFTPYL
jgi:cardiolipin synthase